MYVEVSALPLRIGLCWQGGILDHGYSYLCQRSRIPKPFFGLLAQVEIVPLPPPTCLPSQCIRQAISITKSDFILGPQDLLTDCNRKIG